MENTEKVKEPTSKLSSENNYLIIKNKSLIKLLIVQNAKIIEKMLKIGHLIKSKSLIIRNLIKIKISKIEIIKVKNLIFKKMTKNLLEISNLMALKALLQQVKAIILNLLLLNLLCCQNKQGLLEIKINLQIDKIMTKRNNKFQTSVI